MQAKHAKMLSLITVAIWTKKQEAVSSYPPAEEDKVRACRTVKIQIDTTTVHGLTCTHGQENRWREPQRACCRSGATERPCPPGDTPRHAQRDREAHMDKAACLHPLL